MINREKVIRMTKMASYEAHGGKKDKAAACYFRSDYIGMQVLLSLVVITVAFLAGFGAYVVFHFTEVMENIYSMDMSGTARRLLTLYFVLAALYMAATYAVYAVRYAKARKRLALFEEYLDCLERTEEEDDTERN
ncbi:MAG: hypothetical protein Q4C65_12380 [Eubacteriales bacterium]|nr:hypothetical protein [Eubacteriales bacterium]